MFMPACLTRFQQFKEHIIHKINISNKDDECTLNISKNMKKCLRALIRFFDDEKNTKGIVILPKTNNKELVPSLLPYILGSTTVLYIGSSITSMKKFRDNIITHKNGKPNVYTRTRIIKESEQYKFLPSIYTNNKKTMDNFPKGKLIYAIHIKEDESSMVDHDELDKIKQLINNFNIDLVILDNAYSYPTNIWNLFAGNLTNSKCVFLSNVTIPNEKKKNKLPLKVIGIFQK